MAALALALASGRSLTAWARENQTPARTARRWAALPEVRDQVERIRRKAVDRAIGKLTRHATRAAAVLAELAEARETPPAVRLSAARAVLQELLSVREHNELADRVAELERKHLV